MNKLIVAAVLLLIATALVISCAPGTDIVGVVGDNQTTVQIDDGTVIINNYSAAVVSPDGTINAFAVDETTGDFTATEIIDLQVADIEYGLDFTDIVYTSAPGRCCAPSNTRVYLNFLLRNFGTATLTSVKMICRFNYGNGTRQYYEFWLTKNIQPGLLGIEEVDVSTDTTAHPTSIDFIQIIVNGTVLLSPETPYVLYP